MSKIEIGTEKFKEAVNKSLKGVGNSNILLITTLIGLEGKNGNLVLTSTDNSTNLRVVLKEVLPADVEFYTATNANLLSKLVNRTTTATVDLDIQDDRIVFGGNCDANLEIVLNDEGSAPCKISKIVVNGEGKDVKISELKMFLSYLKSTLPTSVDNPWFTGYRLKDGIGVTYNDFAASLIEIDWKDDDILLTSNLVKLFSLLEGETAKVVVEDGKIKVSTENVEITGALRADVDKYGIDRYKNLIYSETVFNTKVVMDKAKFVEALDRISLFIKPDDHGVFTFELNKDSILLLSNDNNYVEKVVFEESTNEEVIQRNISIDTLNSAISALQGDKITANFGKDGGVRIHEGKAYMVMPYARAKKI